MCGAEGLPPLPLLLLLQLRLSVPVPFLLLLPPPRVSDMMPNTSPSPPMSPARATGRRKAEESSLAGSDSDGDGETSSASRPPRQRMRRPSTGPVSSETTIPASTTPSLAWMKLLDKIRALPPSTFRPYYPRTVERGTRSVKEAKSWICQQCQCENAPTKHLLFDLPAVNCNDCGFPPPEVTWQLTQVSLESSY